MTSSWALKKLREQGSTWDIANFGDPDNSLGGWEDHYIINGAHRECHPDFEAMPIGNPYGFMICKRRKRPDGRGFDTPLPFDPSQFNGYNKFSADMYRPWRDTAIQLANPDGYYDRKVPNEEYLHLNDYLSRDTYYDGIGTKPVHTPMANGEIPREFGFSFTNTKNPPRKYDVQQLHQRFPQWMRLQSAHGVPQSELDKISESNKEYVTMATW